VRLEGASNERKEA